MITSVTHIDFSSLRLIVNTPFHWAIIFIALLGLLLSCGLIYRRFRKETRISSTTNTQGLNKNIHLSLLILGNIVAFISVLLFLLPFEMKMPTSSYDVLLTNGFKKSLYNEDFNINGVDNTNIARVLKSANRIWLLSDFLDKSNYNQALKEWLAKNYQDKTVVIASVEELIDVWSGNELKQSKTYSDRYAIPTLLQVFGDGLSKIQWQKLHTFNQLITNKLDTKTLGTNNLSSTSLNSTNQSTKNPSAEISDPLNKSSSAESTIKFTFYKSKPITGLRFLQWPKQLILGQALTVTGQLQHSLDTNTKFELSLINNGRIQDSVIVQKNNTFSLSSTSKIAGLFNYQLVLQELPSSDINKIASVNANISEVKKSENSQIKISEDIAVSVINGNQPRVLIKQSAPSFETRRLKQWLSETGSEVTVISQISKNKWSQQRVNTAQEKNKAQTSELTKALLDNYDLMIVDSRMLLALEESELDALYQAIKQGLGLLINADSSLLIAENNNQDKLSKLLRFFELTPIEPSINQVTANWPEKPTLAKGEVISVQAITINMNAKQGQALVESAIGQALVAKQPLGLGTVALTTLNETYQWSSQISPAYYSAYWQYLLLNISRVEKNTRWLTPAPEVFAKVNQFENICLISSQEKLYVPNMVLTTYPLSKHKQCGQFIAGIKGWYSFKVLNDKQVTLTEQHRYYYSDVDFPAWQQAMKHQASENQLVEGDLNNIVPLENKAANLSFAYQPINKFILWLIMFLSLTLLWIERKWQGS